MIEPSLFPSIIIGLSIFPSKKIDPFDTNMLFLLKLIFTPSLMTKEFFFGKNVFLLMIKSFVKKYLSFLKIKSSEVVKSK